MAPALHSPLPPPPNLTLRALEETSALLHEAMQLTKAMGGSKSPVPLHEVGLTLAALDLSLTFRVHRMIPGMKEKESPDKVTYSCLQQAVESLKHAGGPANHPHGGFGGADSILLYLSHALATLNKCLKGLKHVTRAREIWRTRLRAVALVLLALVWKKKRGGKKLVLWLLGLSYAARKVHFWTLQRSVDTSHRRLLTLLRLWVIMDCVMVYTENCKDRNVAHHTLIARPFQDDVKAQRWLSRQLLEAVPPPPETAFWYEASPVAAFLRRFMMVVYASFGNGVSASGFRNALGHSPWRWRLVGVPVTAASFLYYMLRPGIASRDAVHHMSPAPIELLQKAWTSAHNPFTEWVGLRLAHRQGLVWQRRVVVAGVSCYVFAREDPGLSTEEETKKSVLFFVHGGGFVAHLFLADMPVLTAWTVAMGRGAVLIIPEYTLIPHGRFPLPVQELLGVYKVRWVCSIVCWGCLLMGCLCLSIPPCPHSPTHLLSKTTQAVRNGTALGFVPAQVAVAGESAGGNLASSLCVALAGAVVEAKEAADKAKRARRQRRQAGFGEEEEEEREKEEGGAEKEKALARLDPQPHLISVELPVLVEGKAAMMMQRSPSALRLMLPDQAEEKEVGGGVEAEGAVGKGGDSRASHTSSEADTDEGEDGEDDGHAHVSATLPAWLRMPDSLVLFYPGTCVLDCATAGAAAPQPPTPPLFHYPATPESYPYRHNLSIHDALPR